MTTTTTTDRFGMTVLATNESLELLRSSVVGRLAVSITEYPDIFPINYVVDHGCIVFRTAEGTKLAAAVLGRGVAFEVDGYDQARGEAWSVVVKGHGRRNRARCTTCSTPSSCRCSRGKPHRSPVSCGSNPSTSPVADSTSSKRPARPASKLVPVWNRRLRATDSVDRETPGTHARAPPTPARSEWDRSRDVARSEGDGTDHVARVGTVTLSWLPLGAGHHVVRGSGHIFEALSAVFQRRTHGRLYHTALEIDVPAGRFVIEMAPVPDTDGQRRGVVAEGPVGMRWAGRFRAVPIRDPPLEERRHPGRARRHVHHRRQCRRRGASSWSSSRPFQRSCGAVTSSAPARCGTRTRSRRGCSLAADSTPRSSSLQQAVALRAGEPA